MIEPIKQECNHNFCFYFFEEMKESLQEEAPLRCPLCKEQLERNKNYKVDSI